MKELLLLSLTCLTLFAQRTPLKVNGTVVDNPNFQGSQFANSGANVGLNASLLSTNKQEWNSEITLGTATNVVVDPYYRGVQKWAPTANCRWQLGTNTLTGTNYGTSFALLVYDSVGGKQITNVVDTYTPRGNVGPLKLGWNLILGEWDAGILFVSHGESQIPATSVGDGTVDDTEFGKLNNVNSTILTDVSTNSLTNKTFDSGATGNVMKFTDYMQFVYPARLDGTGCTAITNDYTSSLWGLATYSSSAATNANYAMFVPTGFVPPDLDSGVTMTLNLAIRISSTDTTSETFTVGYFNPASSAGFAPTDYTGLSSYVSFTTGTLTSAAANDVFYVGPITLTGWASGLTTGRSLRFGIARSGTANANSITIVGGMIAYGRTQ